MLWRKIKRELTAFRLLLLLLFSVFIYGTFFKPNTHHSIKVVGRVRTIWDDRRDEVVESFRHAWKGYKDSAWGYDELLPISKQGSNWFKMGCTIIDALDTALIMEQDDIYFDAKHWIESDLKYDGDGDSNVFEITIRVLGGLLSTYTFTEEQVFLDKAIELADILLIAFESPSKIPFSSIDFSKRVAVPSPGTFY